MPEQIAASETVRRPSVVTADPEDTPGAEVIGEVARRRWLGVGAVVVVVVALAAGLALSRSGAHSNVTTTTLRSSTPPTIATSSGPSAATGFAATRTPNGNAVQFTWTVPNEQPGDLVGWRLAGSTNPPTPVTTNEAVVPATGSVCIEVDVQSANGTQASPAKFCGG